jgi:hypothetical protein
VLPGGDVVLGGLFQSFGGVAASNIVRRVGNAFVPLGLGLNGPVVAMDVAPDGSLVVAGSFTTAGGSPAIGVARWSNGVWSSVGAGPSVTSLEVAAGTGGQVLLRTLSSLRFYDGLSWSPVNVPGVLASIARDPAGGFVLGGQLGFPSVGTARLVQGTVSFTVNQPLVANALGHDRAGRVLAAVDNAGSTRVLRLDGSTWTQLGVDVPGELGERIAAMPNGDPLLVTSPQFAGGEYISELLRFDGTTWVPLQTQLLTPMPSSARSLSVSTTERGELLLAGRLRAVAGQAAFSFAIADAQCPAAVTSFGAGCNGGAGPLVLQADNAAWTGGAFVAEVGGLAANAAAVQVVGTAAPAVTLPNSAGGCSIYTSPLILGLLAPSAGSVNAGFDVPRSAALAGVAVRMQVVGAEISGAALVRLASSNALDLVIGSW